MHLPTQTPLVPFWGTIRSFHGEGRHYASSINLKFFHIKDRGRWSLRGTRYASLCIPLALRWMISRSKRIQTSVDTVGRRPNHSACCRGGGNSASQCLLESRFTIAREHVEIPKPLRKFKSKPWHEGQPQGFSSLWCLIQNYFHILLCYSDSTGISFTFTCNDPRIRMLRALETTTVSFSVCNLKLRSSSSPSIWHSHFLTLPSYK